MKHKTISLPDLENLVGQEIGLSRWFTMDQDRITTFADVTEDQQFIHTDPARAAQTPFGGTIAHGFLTLSMLSIMVEESAPLPEGLMHTVNYGFNRIRFISPVPTGAQIRAHFELMSLETAEGQATLTLKVTIEIKDSEKPALVAEWILRHYFS